GIDAAKLEVKIPLQCSPSPIGLPPKELIVREIVPARAPNPDGDRGQNLVDVKVCRQISSQRRNIRVDGRGRIAARGPELVQHLQKRRVPFPTMHLQAK